VFAVRRQVREVAASLGLSGQDQIRVAAGLSEVGRRLVVAFGVATITFALDAPDDSDARSGGTLGSSLVVRASAAGTADDDLVDALHLTKGLMDWWEVHRRDGETTVVMARRLPDRATRLTASEFEALRSDLAHLTAGTAMEELAEHNRQLLATLAEVQTHRDDLLRLNAELEATNQGVVALYSELSDEMEATNRGVVALYAELDQRNADVRAASAAKTRFLSNVSHELRAPVTSIVGLVRLLRDPSSDPLTADQAHQLELIDGSAHGLLTLVNELLDLAKAESGRLDPTNEYVDLAGIFDTLRGTLRALPAGPDTELVVVPPVDVPPLFTDPVMLAQVLRNLLTNGIKFTPAGEVRLTAAVEPDGFVALTVSDTGIGIPADEQERVFEEFHQVRNNLQASVTGTGLGLPYARRLVHILGGTIDLVSVPDEGSTFVVRLPVGEPGVAPAEPPKIGVLVVDDDEGFRMAAAGVLRGCGYTVFEVADGHAAIQVAQIRQPDMIFLDLRLAEFDGFAVLDAFAADETLRDIPVVIVTAYPEDLGTRPTGDRAIAILDKTATTLDDLCTVVRSTVRPSQSG
jgi:signal transduction histidine kinase/CheY-like chemotaxis protein